ncbi:MAG: type I DNA topoisomerase [Bacteroidales bacterium]|nr:type I DNA topoisomerase [Bacteroidales bacterium]
MTKNLVIVESPAKAKTIEKFLGKDFIVKSSFGHVRDLSKDKLGVDVKKDFAPKYVNDPEKKKVIAELKKLSDTSELVWLATDEDREGEAIAWHLKETLGLTDEKIKRIVFHEITKTAIINAVENPRNIDYDLVKAQQARRVLDRLVGFELSPLLWKKVKPSLSAGRVQSVAVRLIVDREEEIKNFKVESFYKVYGYFLTSKEEIIKAEAEGKFETKEEALMFLEQCKSAKYMVDNIEKKPTIKSPAPPFTTSTLQQEASRKLGFSVSKTMMTAQKLYESGQITYMRTDSVNLSGLAINTTKEEIIKLFGAEYSKPRQFSTKSKGAQEAHEAIRPTYINRENATGDQNQKKLYDLIWKRTVASQMAEAKLEKTIITINSNELSKAFIADGETLLFDGFLKLYSESSDSEESENKSNILPSVNKGENLQYKTIEASQRFTRQQPRYTEASLVRKMEELGIGRPSTYAPTITTIINRKYVVKENKDGQSRKANNIILSNGIIKENHNTENFGAEKNKLFPTDVGTLVNSFLVKYFPEIVDYQFTAQVEKEFDLISSGQSPWNQMIKGFYKEFSEKIIETTDNTEKFTGERLLGTDPKTGKNVYVKVGKYGPIVQIGETTDEEKPKFAGLNKNQKMEEITLAEALKLFDFPRAIGNYQDEELTVAVGRFGPYIKMGKAFFSIPKTDSPATIELKRAIEIIEEKKLADKNKTIQEFKEEPDLKVLNGRFGPYISFNKNNYKIPKTKDPKSLSLEECKEIIAKSETKTKKPRKKDS